MRMWPRSAPRKTLAGLTAGGLLVLGLAACGSSPSSASSGVALSAKQTIVFASAGLGTEGTATMTAIKGFEKLHPNITVSLMPLSSNSTVAQEQEEHNFIAGSTTPDVVYTDVTWPSTFARSGWIANLSSYHPDTSEFFPGQMATGEYDGGVYAIPWFINAEGIYYNTSIIKTAPTTEAQLVSDAQKALKTDPSLKEGLAFEGDEYEGAVTAWQSFGADISLSALNNIDTPANVAALTFMYDAIHTYKISPAAVTGWQEPNVQAAWLAGQTPFALNWPYIFALSQSTSGGKPLYPAVYNKTAWIPFPSATPQSSLGGDDLAINAKSTHKAAAWAFIQYLTSVSAQDARAISAGDPPSVKTAYDSALYSAAPYFKDEAAVYDVVTPRPVTPVYPQISSSVFQPMISSVLSGQATPSAALSSNVSTVMQLLQTAGS
jgi:multiple sugar transport system substrate-binding protein